MKRLADDVYCYDSFKHTIRHALFRVTGICAQNSIQYLGIKSFWKGYAMLPNHFTDSYSVVLGPQYDESKRDVLNASQCADKGVNFSIEIREKTDGCIELIAKVSNNTDREISEVVFPDWELETKGTGSGFTMPVGPGWWQPFEPLDEGEHVKWNYPIFGAMQWVDYCDDDSGFYMGVHDKTPYIKIFSVGKRNGNPWVQVRFTDIQLMPGETFELPPIVVKEHKGDWHEAAKIYRSWAQSWMEKPSGAEWYNDAPAWCWLGMKGQHARKPDRMFQDVPQQAKKESDYGVKVSNLSSWMEHGHDTHYPDYTAGESMGGESAMIKAVDDVHAMGLRICLYTNGRIADPEGSIGQMPGWQEWACQAPSPDALVPMEVLHANFTPQLDAGLSWNTGTVATEGYGKVDFAVMCPGSREWRDLFIERMAYMARTYKVDGTFIDQINGCWALPCYSDKHDHKRPNESWHGYLTLLKDLREALRSINPEFLMSTEGVCDIHGQYFDVQQGHNDWDTQVGTKSRPMPELYTYTFPWYIVNTGFASDNNYYYLKLAHAVGSGIDVTAINTDTLEDRFLSYLKQIMQWRKDYVDTLFGGEFLGALKCDNPHYLAHAFRKDGRIVVTAAWTPYKVEAEEPASVTLKLGDCRAVGARLFTESGEADVKVSDDGCSLTLPFSQIAVLEIDLKGQS